MSVLASINIHITTNSQVFDQLGIIQSLIDYGWTTNDYGHITYLPLGDDGDYNWCMENISSNALNEILKQKVIKNEIIGIVLTWGDTNIGFSLLMNAIEGNLSFCLTVNRRTLALVCTDRITDVNWYLERLIPALDSARIQYDSIEFTQF